MPEPRVVTKEDTSKNHSPIIEKAESFHGHLGPFLVIGVRMGQVGLNRLRVAEAKSIRITASLPLHVPFSCILDGLQIATKCTVGNRKLSLVDSAKIEAEFKRKDGGQKITVALNQSVIEKLELLPKEPLTDEELRELAWRVASVPEDELFVVAPRVRPVVP